MTTCTVCHAVDQHAYTVIHFGGGARFVLCPECNEQRQKGKLFGCRSAAPDDQTPAPTKRPSRMVTL